MRSLFYSLAHYDDEMRIYYYNIFVSVNDGIDSFKELPLDKRSDSWSGSEIPRIVKRQTFLRKLMESFSSTLDLLRHRSYLQDIIDGYELRKRDVRIREMLSDY